MEFLITQYIYPLQEPIQLSEKLGFSLDNPRTELEIAAMEDYLLRAHESGYDFRLPPYSDEDIVTIEDTLLSFGEIFSAEDQYVDRFFKSYERENMFSFLAKMWVIARFDDGGIGDELRSEHQKMQEKGEHGFFILDEEHPLTTKSKLLADYFALLSLLSHKEGNDYFGRPIIMDSNHLHRNSPAKRIWQQFMLFSIIVISHPKDDDSLSWVFFPYSREKIIEVAETLDSFFASGLESTLLYVGNLLNIASDHTLDIRTRILILTSVVELLLTHNPDFNRYNVEDSINKQFQLKASLLIYLNDKTKDINLIKQRLKTIYSQRSNIAHGNFKEFQKYKGKVKKNDGYVDDLVSDLYAYIRAIVEEYVKDPVLIAFLKDS